MAIKTSLGAKRYNNRMDEVWERAKQANAAHEEAVKGFSAMKNINKAATAFKKYQMPASMKTTSKPGEPDSYSLTSKKKDVGGALKRARGIKK